MLQGDDRLSSDAERLNSLIGEFSVEPEREDGQVRTRHPKNELSGQEGAGNRSRSWIRDRYVRAGRIPGFPVKPAITRQQGSTVSFTHKLDSVLSGFFDPDAGGWADKNICGYLFNDTGVILGGYRLTQVDAEGTIDTVFKYEYRWGEDGFLTEEVTYQWNGDSLRLLPWEKRLHENYRPDSVVIDYYTFNIPSREWELSRRSVDHYKEGRASRTESYVWLEEEGEWRIDGVTEYAYDVGGITILILDWTWDEEADSLICSDMREEDYDQFGNEILFALSSWNADENEWETWLKTTRSYNGHNRLLERSDFFWIDDSLGLVELDHEDYEYESDTLLIVMTRYDFVTDSLKLLPTRREEYSYDESYRMEVRLNYIWERLNQFWSLDSRVDYEYDQEGLLVREVTSDWTGSDPEWVPDRKDEHEYDQQGRQVSIISYIWPAYAVDWQKDKRVDFAYDAYGNLSQVINWRVHEFWDEWIPVQREWTVFNEKGSIVRRTISLWEEGVGKWTYRGEAFEYSPYGYLLEHEYFWDGGQEGNRWRSLTEIVYNDKELFSGWREYEWDSREEGWKEYYRGECTYGALGKVISVKSTWFDDLSEEWIDEEQVDAVYDQEARITSLTYRDWDPSEQEWVIWELDSLSYNGQGRITQLLYLDWNDNMGALVNRGKWEYSYDGNGDPTSEKYMYRDDQEAAWIPVLFTQYEFNGDHQLVGIQEHEWAQGTGSWAATSLEEISYTALGNRSQMIRNRWDGASMKWDAYQRIVFAYDGTGNLLTRERSEWDQAGEEWNSLEREVYTYEPEIDAAEVWLPFQVGYNADEIFQIRYDNEYAEYFYDPDRAEELFYWEFGLFEDFEIHQRFNAPRRISFQDWNGDAGGWLEWETMDFFFSAGIYPEEVHEATDEPGFRVFPNPAGNLLNLLLPESEKAVVDPVVITICNLVGRQVVSLVSGADDPVDVSTLGSGIYVISVRTSGRNHYAKFIKE